MAVIFIVTGEEKEWDFHMMPFRVSTIDIIFSVLQQRRIWYRALFDCSHLLSHLSLSFLVLSKSNGCSC